MDLSTPEVPRASFIPPILTVNKDGNIEIAKKNHPAFNQLPIFERILQDFRGIKINELRKQSNLMIFFRDVSLLAGEIVEDNPNFIRDRWFDLVAEVFSDSYYEKISGYTDDKDRHLFAQLFLSLNNLLGDPQKQIKPEERGLFYKIFLEYLQGKRGVLEGINDEDFYNDLRKNTGQIFELLGQGEADSRFIIVLNYSLLAYKDWANQRSSLQNG